jgi:hypothetical protein
MSFVAGAGVVGNAGQQDTKREDRRERARDRGALLGSRSGGSSLVNVGGGQDIEQEVVSIEVDLVARRCQDLGNIDGGLNLLESQEVALWVRTQLVIEVQRSQGLIQAEWVVDG